MFEKAFQAAEIAKFDPGQRNTYENSLKYYRDLNTSFEEGKIKGIPKGLEKGIKAGKTEVGISMLNYVFLQSK